MFLIHSREYSRRTKAFEWKTFKGFNNAGMKNAKLRGRCSGSSVPFNNKINVYITGIRYEFSSYALLMDWASEQDELENGCEVFRVLPDGSEEFLEDL